MTCGEPRRGVGACIFLPELLVNVDSSSARALLSWIARLMHLQTVQTLESHVTGCRACTPWLAEGTQGSCLLCLPGAADIHNATVQQVKTASSS